MGLWDWVVDTLVGNGGTSTPSADHPHAALNSSTSIATLDPDQDPAEINQIQATTNQWWAPTDVTQTEPLMIAAPPLTAETRAIKASLESHFDGHNLTLPTMPLAAESVLKRLRDPRCSMSDVAKDISEDQVMAADILRIANSAFYRGTETITSLQAAVTRLGSTAIRTLMMHQSLRAATFYSKAKDRELADLLWVRSIASATIMQSLSRFTLSDPDDAFLIGLLHDIGNIVVLRTVYEQESRMDYRIDIDSFESLCFEYHQKFGELIANSWQLPMDIKDLISNHHELPPTDDPHRTARLMILLADMITQMLGYNIEAQYNLLESQPVIELGLSERGDFVTFLAELPDQIQEATASF